MTESSAKRFLREKQQKRLEESLAFAEINLQQIELLLDRHRKEDKQIIFGRIKLFLESAKAGTPINLELPSMDLGLLSLIFQNISLYLGNTQQSLKIQQGNS